MIRVTVLAVRIPGAAADALLESEAYLCPGRIDTITPVTNPAQHQCAPGAKAVIRYCDSVSGYRLYFVRETAREVARKRRREMQGEDSDGLDYGNVAAES